MDIPPGGTAGLPRSPLPKGTSYVGEVTHVLAASAAQARAAPHRLRHVRPATLGDFRVPSHSLPHAISSPNAFFITIDPTPIYLREHAHSHAAVVRHH